MTKKIKLKISARLLKKRIKKTTPTTVKRCRFCGVKDQERAIDYKNAEFLRGFLTERGKMLPSRISGACCKHQRWLSREVRKARTMALLPYSAKYY